MAVTYYDVLGVSPSATSEQVRAAYRALARRLHPDATAAASGGLPSDDDAMQALNEAWRVLGDPARRSAYDRSLRQAAPSPPPAARPFPEDFDDDLDRPFRGRPAAPGDLAVAVVRSLPWIVLGVILGGIFVFTAFAGGGSDRRGDPDPDELIGRCVLAAGRAASPADCGDPGARFVKAVVARTGDCPGGTNAGALIEGRWLCLAPVSGPASTAPSGGPGGP